MRRLAVAVLLAACGAHAQTTCTAPTEACALRQRAFEAIRNGDSEGLAKALGPAAVAARYRPGVQELIAAARAGIRLVHRGRGTAPAREDPVGVAVRLRMVESLVEAGADVNERYEHLLTAPVFDVNFEADAPILEFLLRKGATSKATDFGRAGLVRSVLANVLSWEDGNVVGRLLPLVLKGGADVNERAPDGRTLLMRISARGRPERVAWLIENGAQVGERDVEGRNALMAAAGEGHTGIVRLLLRGGAHVNAVDTGGATALHYASHHAGVIALLIENGASPRVRDLLGDTPLHWLARSVPVLDYRLRAGKSAEALERLEREVRAARLSAAKALLGSGADGNARNAHGVSPLHLAAFAEMAEALIDGGAEVGVTNAYGYTPLHSAWNRAPEIAVALMRRGANIDAATVDGERFLHLAAQSGRAAPAIVEAVSRGARLDARTRNGRTPLHYALARSCYPDVVGLLLEKGADASLEDSAGDTPALLWAANVKNDYQGRCRTALEQGGVDLGKPNSHGVSPLELASRPRPPEREGERPASLTIRRF